MEVGDLRMSVRAVDPDGVDAHWPLVEPGMAVAVRRSFHMTTVRAVRGRLLTGEYQLLVLYAGGSYAGFAVARLDDAPGGLWLNLVMVYTVPETSRESDVLAACQEEVLEWARGRGCVAAHFYSGRAGFLRRRAKDLGWSPRFVEYVRRLAPSGVD